VRKTHFSLRSQRRDAATVSEIRTRVGLTRERGIRADDRFSYERFEINLLNEVISIARIDSAHCRARGLIPNRFCQSRELYRVLFSAMMSRRMHDITAFSRQSVDSTWRSDRMFIVRELKSVSTRPVSN